MRFGNIKLKNGISLAPMAGVTDRAYREIMREFGCEYAVTEMISAKALEFGSDKTAELAEFSSFDRPVAIQLFGSDPAIMASAAARIEETFRPDAIDINMGCPMKKIVSNGEGSSLMRQPDTAGKIVRAVRASVKIPVTVKIRIGWEESEKNAAEFAKMLENSGADLITIHGRTRNQFYEGQVDLETIRSVKKAVGIPVFGNGNIFTSEDYRHMKEFTGCDGVMIARGSQGNPWIFREISDFCENTPYKPPETSDKLAVIHKHMSLMYKYKGSRGIVEARRQLVCYLKGFRGAASLRREAVTVESFGDIERLIERIPVDEQMII
jgi:tRNA-dihydrouridine synthase B